MCQPKPPPCWALKVRLWHRPLVCHGLRDDARMQPGYLPHEHLLSEPPSCCKRFREQPEPSSTLCVYGQRICASAIWPAWAACATVDELVGRTDLLKSQGCPPGWFPRKRNGLTALVKKPLVETAAYNFNAKRRLQLRPETPMRADEEVHKEL